MAPKFEWTENCERSFQELKAYLAKPPILSKTKKGETLVLYLAASEHALGAALIREEGLEQFPVYYTSHALQGAQVRYQRIEKLALALVLTARRLRPYFQQHTIQVRTDQPLRQILQKPDLAGRMTSWAIELSEFDICYEPRKAIKAQALADFVAELTPTGESKDITLNSPTWLIHVDGSSTKKACGAGVIVESPDGVTVEQAILFSFKTSNNQAEYEALIAGIKLAQDLGATRVKLFSDSQLVVSQIQGDFEIKDNTIKRYVEYVQKLLEGFEVAHLERIPRTMNTRADALSKLASSTNYGGHRSVIKAALTEPSINHVLEIHAENSWITPIKAYLEGGTLPTEKGEARKIIRQAARYFVWGNDLYKKGFSSPHLRCIAQEEAEYVLRELHEGVCGSHQSAGALRRKALRAGYYWPTMRTDAERLVKSCDQCQRHSNFIHIPANEQKSIHSPWPFEIWGMDILGPFPVATGQRKFLIVAIDLFTKWIEAEPLATISANNTQKFLWQNIICRFGPPFALITDNGRQFISEKFEEFCKEWKIDHRTTSVEHPASNGQTELANRIILEGLKKRLGNAKGRWVEELPCVLWSYRTTVQTSTGETPFALTYGHEALIPAELGCPSDRVIYKSDQNQQDLLVNLDGVEEAREMASIKAAAYKQKAALHHNKKIRARSFQEGDLVLRTAINNRKDPTLGKLAPNWEGPYRIIQVIPGGAYRIARLSGEKIPNTWNAASLRHYYL